MPQPRRRIWLRATVLVAGFFIALTALTACNSGTSDSSGGADTSRSPSEPSEGTGDTDTSAGSEDSGGENSGGSNTSGGVGRSGGSDQVLFQKKAERDRAGLFEGQLDYDPPSPVNVNDTTEFTVTLSALSSAQPQPSHVVARRNLWVGGVQGAELTAPDGDVDVELTGSNHQLLTRNTSVEWQWNLTPRKPGRHRLNLVIETYQGSSSNVLARTSPPLTLDLAANTTFGYQVSEMKEWIIAAGAVLGASGVILAFFRKPLVALASKSLGRKRKDSDQS
ncbi:hypothetical protein [Streptomyces sp. NPDC023838]|uniref:hypothetical protein n=1 Tax=Streptomyces sp. NPDC023838 TaxID=3154325 RepID=UPI0033DE3B5D